MAFPVYEPCKWNDVIALQGLGIFLALFLVVGPSEKEMQRWLDSVTCVNTDFGVEAGMCLYLKLLPLFLLWIQKPKGGAILHQTVPLPEGGITGRLFKYADMFIGWGHLWDAVLKDALNWLPWWPQYMVLAKHITVFSECRCMSM